MCVCVCVRVCVLIMFAYQEGAGMGRSVCMALQYVNSSILCTGVNAHVCMVVTVSVWMSLHCVCVQVCTCLISLWDSVCVCVCVCWGALRVSMKVCPVFVHVVAGMGGGSP